MKRPRQEDYPDTMHGIGYNDYVEALEKYCNCLEKQIDQMNPSNDTQNIIDSWWTIDDLREYFPNYSEGALLGLARKFNSR